MSLRWYNSGMKCKRNSDARSIDHHALQVMRQQAIKAIGQGQKVQDVSAAFGVNVRSVFRWLSSYASGGQNALLAKAIPGRPPKITSDEMRWLERTLKDDTPQQHKFEFALWTLPLIGELLYRQFGKRLSPGTVSRMLRMLGFSPQKPLYRAWQQDPELVRTWRQTTYPAIQAEAKAVGATIYFGDEAGIRSDHHRGTTWAPVGKTPVVKATGRRFSLNMLSAVSARGEFRFMLHDGSVGAKVFMAFLKRLMAGAQGPIFLIVDGHPAHKAKIIREFIDAQDGKLKLFYLPPYSPQLNPDEQVWLNVKTRVSKQLPQNIIELKSAILAVMHRLQKLPATVRGFFLHPDCRYAAI